jgi:Cd2+/Zn2+-exporting ATPase
MAEETIQLKIDGMDCSDCALVIEHSLRRMEGVHSVTASFAAQNVHVAFDRRKLARGQIEGRLRSLGYQVQESRFRSWYKQNHELVFSLLAGLFLAVGWLAEIIFNPPEQVVTALYLVSCGLGGWEIAKHTWSSLRHWKFDTDLLMLAAAAGAGFLGQWMEAALLLFLFSLGHALEERALDRARSAVRALADLTPRTALVRREKEFPGKNEFFEEKELPVEQILLGDRVIVRPGVRIPVDGQVLSGHSAVNQSPVTGESIPVEKAAGSQVFAGTVNGDGALEVQVTRLAQDSTLARVMKMVEQAQEQKSKTQQLTEKFTRVYVPVVLVAVVLLIFVPPLFGVPFQESFLRAMTLLVAASPCALVLGTPSAILAGVARAARDGVLIKGGAYLENLGQVRAMAFDKTGTLTEGQPRVTDLLGASQPEEMLRLAAAVEVHSIHPLARAVVAAARERGLELPPAQEVFSINGRGVRAWVEGRQVEIGSLRYFEETGAGREHSGLELSDGMSQAGALRKSTSVQKRTSVQKMRESTPGTSVAVLVQQAEDQGKTAFLVFLDGNPAGVIAVADSLRPGARQVIDHLRALGMRKTVMLTGDNSRVARQIASQAGLSDFRAGLMPEDKMDAVRELVSEFGPTAMVGDGVNDAPALASATVGIAMGGGRWDTSAATDAALESADIVLMGADLARLPFAVGLSRVTRRIILQNLVVALGVIAMLVTFSVAGWAGIGAAVLFHEGSTILVVLNSLRLLRFNPRYNGH